MRFFDLHCDTIGECSNKQLSLRKNSLHIDLERARSLEEYTQVFAIWIPDELRGKDAVDYFDKTADYFYKEIEKNKDLISVYGSDKATPVKAMLSLEGGSGCGGTIEGLHHLFSRGVRIITLTWNDKNEIGSGAFSEGGLTSFGKEFIKEAENLGIVLDVSHLNRQSFFEFSQISRKPFIASHSNADIVNNKFARKRNLTKEQIEIIRDINGLIGLNFCMDFIEDEKSKGIDAISRQLEFMLSSGCEDIIALGSDFDGCVVNRAFNDVQKLPQIYHSLNSKGFSEKILNKIFGENAHRFFENNKTVSSE